MGRPSDGAAAALELLAAGPATLGVGRLLAIDGPSGSGKTTIATDVARLVPDVQIVHMDDLIHGWDGLPDVGTRLDALLRPVAAGRVGAQPRYDWVAGAPGDPVTIEPAPLVVVEGVGAGSLPIADLVTVLVWVEADHDVRMERGIERDGDTFRPYWEQWAAAEQEHFATHRTRERADLVVRT